MRKRQCGVEEGVTPEVTNKAFMCNLKPGTFPKSGDAQAQVQRCKYWNASMKVLRNFTN